MFSKAISKGDSLNKLGLDQEWIKKNSLSVLDAHNNIVDNVSLLYVAERFANAKEKRRIEFGTCTEKDIH